MKSLLLTTGVLLALGANAADAVWQGTAGGNLDDSANWSTSSGNNLINTAQTAPFTVSTAAATLGGHLRYNYAVYTNDFGSGNQLTLSTVLHVQSGGTLVQRSGSVSAPGGGYLTDSSHILVDGSSASLVYGNGVNLRNQGSVRVYPTMVVTNGGTVSISGNLTIYGGLLEGYVQASGVGSVLNLTGVLGFGGNAVDLAASPTKRSVRVSDGATASWGSVQLGIRSGNNSLFVEDGAQVMVAGDLSTYAYEPVTNNLVWVRNASLSATRVWLGYYNQSTAIDNRILVTEGGKFAVTSSDANCKLTIGGYLSHHNAMTVSGCGSSLWTKYGTNIGTEGVGTNTLTIADGGWFGSAKIVTLGGSGVDNRLDFASGATGELYAVSVAADAVLTARDATLTITNALALETGSVANFSNVTFAANSISVASGASLDVRDSTVALTNSITGSGVISLTDLTMDLCRNKSGSQMDFGGTGMEISFTNCTLSSQNRLNLSGDNFTWRLIDTSLDYQSSNWLMLGSGTYEEGDSPLKQRTLVFGGTHPQITTTGNGVYFRGADTLRFEIPSGGFPTDRAIIEVGGSGKFTYDGKNAKAALRIIVDVDPRCRRLGTKSYTLMRGTDATAFVGNVELTERCAAYTTVVSTTVDGKSAIQVKVKSDCGLVIVVR